MKLWLDGEIVELDQARISPLDRGLTVGDGVFETLRVYDGVPFAWTRHEERLRISAKGLDLAILDGSTLRRAAHDIVAANGLRDARLRITVTGGEGPPGSSRAGAVARTIIVAVPFVPTNENATVVVAPWTRNEHSATAGLKTLSYAANVRALRYAEQRGASEALFANTQGNLCEATGSNVFAVLGGVLCTPPPTAGCLLGVTRGLVLELASELGIPNSARDIVMSELSDASEIFLSSTTREVQRVTHIATRRVHGTPIVSERLAVAYTDLVARDLDP